MNDDELIDQMVQRLGAELKGLARQIVTGRVAVGSLEGLIRGRLWHVGAQAFGVMVEALDRQLVSPGRVQDYRTRTVVSLFGPVDVCRRRYRTGDGWDYPLDRLLGLMGQRGWSLGVQEAVSLLSCDMSFQSAAEDMGRLLGVSMTDVVVEELAEASGQRAEGLEASVQPGASREVPDTLIVAVDGCQAPQRDGWREVKMATIYPKESRLLAGGGRGRLVRKEYLASLDGAEGFGRRLRRCAEGWGVRRVRRVVVMGDGAPWIWNLSDLQFPGATEIVDFYHAVEHLWAAGEALWGNRDTSVATKGWVRHYRKKLRGGWVEEVVAGMERALARKAKTMSPQRSKTVALNMEYFRRNAQRMRYGRFRQMGLPIGTGAVEGSCKHVVQSRFKRPGMRWTGDGMRKMLALRTLRLNQRWELLWPHLTAA